MFFKNLFKAKPAPDPNAIFIGLIGGVGDLVLAAASVAELKRKHPDARICFGVGGPPFYSTIQNDPHVSKFETPFFYNVWKEKERKAVLRDKSREYSRVLLLDNPDREWWKARKHLIDIYAEKCGVELESRRPAMYLSAEDTARAEEVFRENNISKEDKLVVLSPEVRSKREMKEWPLPHFLRLIERINEQHCVKIMVFGSQDECREYPGTITLRGLPIGPSSAIIRRADLFIGLDNGLTHIAGAFDGRIVAIHIGFPKECSAVLSPNAVVIEHEPFCRPDSISVEEVYSKVKDFL